MNGFHRGALYEYLTREKEETTEANNGPIWQKRLINCSGSKFSVPFSLKLMELLIEHRLQVMLYVNGLHATKPFTSRAGI